MNQNTIAKGLAGIYADTTRISTVVEETNTLTYRGYPVQDLAKFCSFEQVAWLLWNEDLPTPEELQTFKQQERSRRALDKDLIQSIKSFPAFAHLMDKLRAALSLLALQDKTAADISEQACFEKSIDLMAKIPTIIAAIARVEKGLDIISPRDDLDFAENFFHMYFGQVPDQKIVKCFDASLTFYAEHGFNASTFAARTIVSTLSDVYAAVVGAIGCLKGPLHGGANESVMHMLLEIDHPDKAQAWIDQALAEKRKIMGFGHRVYRQGDSRVPYMTEVFHEMAKLTSGEKWVEIENILANTMRERKNIYPNLDFPVGPAYYLMGFDIPVFTPIFVMSRITGWTAHVIEQLKDNKIMRPLSLYDGVAQRRVPEK